MLIVTFPNAATDDFKELLKFYQAVQIEFPQLKAISFAQWTLECGWGSTNLASKFHNYGGAKWRPYMNSWASPVNYAAHDGLTQYCKFPSHEMWVYGYWARFDKEPMYRDWRKNTKDSATFLNFIGPIWLGLGKTKGDEYVRHVTRIHDQYGYADLFEPSEKKNAVPIFVDGDGLRRLFPGPSGL